MNQSIKDLKRPIHIVNQVSGDNTPQLQSVAGTRVQVSNNPSLEKPLQPNIQMDQMLSQTSGGSGEKTKIVFSTKAVENDTLHQIDNETEHNGAFYLKKDGKKQKSHLNSPDFIGAAKKVEKAATSTTAAQAS